MSVWDGKIFKENQLSFLGKAAILAILFAAILSAFYNIYHGTVSHPKTFFITLAGLLCFAISKSSLLAKRIWISFGTGKMSENMANLYRLGYWLMIAGIIFTFV